jgi:hypothetical protein
VANGGVAFGEAAAVGRVVVDDQEQLVGGEGETGQAEKEQEKRMKDEG